MVSIDVGGGVRCTGVGDVEGERDDECKVAEDVWEECEVDAVDVLGSG